MTFALEFFTTALLHGTAVAAFAALVDRLARRWLSFGALSVLWVLALVKFVVPWGPSFRFSLSSAVDTGQGVLPFDPIAVITGAPGTPAAPSNSWVSALAVSYLLLVAVLVLRRVRAYRRLSNAVAQLPLADDRVLEVVHEAARRLGVPRVPTVRLGQSAFALGWARPTLVIPATALEGLELQSVVLHELAHLRRNDQWLRLLQHTSQMLFFFWPPVAWVNRHIEHYRELACDEIALRTSDLPVSAYARLLLNARRFALASPPQLALEMSSQSSHLERRIDMLLNLKTRRSVVLSTLTVGSWGLLTLSGSALATGSKETEGTLDKEAIQSVVHKNRDAIRSCYEFAVAKNPKLSGTIVVAFKIGETGATSGVEISEATLTDEQVQQCVVAAISKWSFPAPTGGSVHVHYPFLFTQQTR